MNPNTIIEQLIEALSNAEQETQVTASAQEKEQAQEFIIGSIDEDGRYSFSHNPYIHRSQVAAMQEAERLAVATRGKRFVIVQRLSTVYIEAPKVVWGN